MNKKTMGLLSGVLLITAGLILRSLYKKNKLTGLEDILKPLFNSDQETNEGAAPPMHTAN